MKEEELEEDVEKAIREIDEEESGTEPRSWSRHLKNPFSFLLLLILVLLIIMMVVPYRAIRIDPEPENIPTRDEVLPANIAELRNISEELTKETRANYNILLYPEHPMIRNMAARIATESCPPSELCYAKAMFYFVRDRMQYVSDPPKGYLENPFEVLYQGGADCDGLTILLANLESAVGVPTRFTFIPDHVYLQIKLDEAPRKYKGDDGWVSLDPACSYCEFGEVSFKTFKEQNRFFLYK
jgi:hypothetical protein